MMGEATYGPTNITCEKSVKILYSAQDLIEDFNSIPLPATA